MLMQSPKGRMPKPEISSVAVSGMVMTRQPSSCLNSWSMRLISVVLPAAGPPVRTILVMRLDMGGASFFYSNSLFPNASTVLK